MNAPVVESFYEWYILKKQLFDVFTTATLECMHLWWWFLFCKSLFLFMKKIFIKKSSHFVNTDFTDHFCCILLMKIRDKFYFTYFIKKNSDLSTIWVQFGIRLVDIGRCMNIGIICTVLRVRWVASYACNPNLFVNYHKGTIDYFIRIIGHCKRSRPSLGAVQPKSKSRERQYS